MKLVDRMKISHKQNVLFKYTTWGMNYCDLGNYSNWYTAYGIPALREEIKVLKYRINAPSKLDIKLQILKLKIKIFVLKWHQEGESTLDGTSIYTNGIKELRNQISILKK
jgi:hypothetical protein